MKEIIVITGSDYLIIKNILDTILNQEKVEEAEIYRYDLENDSLDRVIEELDTYNFLTSRKIVIVNNANFLTANINLTTETELADFTKYINNPNKENILILTCSKLDEGKKIVKVLKEKAKIISEDVNLGQYIKDNLEGYKMDNLTSNYFITYCNNDFGKIKNELDKLKLYKLSEQEITKEDIEKIVVKAIDDSDNYLFSLINNIMLLNKKKALEIYEDLVKLRIEPTKLLSMIANQIRFVLQVKILFQEGLKKEEIAKKMNAHPYRVEKAKESALDFSNKILEDNLVKLSDIDLQVKTGEILPDIALKLFIIGM